jgi:hypothetical protein
VPTDEAADESRLRDLLKSRCFPAGNFAIFTTTAGTFANTRLGDSGCSSNSSKFNVGNSSTSASSDSVKDLRWIGADLGTNGLCGSRTAGVDGNSSLSFIGEGIPP